MSLLLACFETVSAGAILVTSWGRVAQFSTFLVAIAIVGLFAARLVLLYMMARCLP